MTEANDLRVRDYLDHIEFAIARIHRYVVGLDRDSFFASEEKQDAVIRNIEIIGEAAQSIRRRHPEFAARHPEIPWGGAYTYREPEIIRLISAWKANKTQRKRYEDHRR